MLAFKFVMLNLLKFKDFADYKTTKNIKETGQEAYLVYLNNIKPLLIDIGSSILFYGDCNSFLVGPEYEKWDAVLLVKHATVEKFIAFSQSEMYLKETIHLKASLLDSRLLPISESNTNM